MKHIEVDDLAQHVYGTRICVFIFMYMWENQVLLPYKYGSGNGRVISLGHVHMFRFICSCTKISTAIYSTADPESIAMI